MGDASVAAILRAGDEHGDLLGVERLVVRQASVGVAANAAEQVAQFVTDDVGPEGLVVQAVVGQEVLVEEVPERAVPHVVQQGGHPHQRLDVGPAGQVRADLPEAVVELVDRPAGQVHGPQNVLEAGVLGRGEDPPGGLQLVDLPQPLDPGVVDDLLLGDLALRQPGRRGEGDVPMDRVVAEAFAVKVPHGMDYAGPGRSRPGCVAGRNAILADRSGVIWRVRIHLGPALRFA